MNIRFFRLPQPLFFVCAFALLLLLLHVVRTAGVSLASNTADVQQKNVVLSNSTVHYISTNELFANPERGFYKHTETHSDSYAPLSVATLQSYRQDNITLILRLFYLDDFVNSSISQTYLDAMQADFDVMRQAGVKSVVRFAYTNQVNGGWPPAPPYGDASKAQVLAHLAQLKPFLQANHDVIAVVQAGFIGIWGEWYYTDHFVADPSHPGNVTVADYANRKEVVDRILDALPTERMVQLRTPLQKQQMYGTGATGAGAALPANQAYQGTSLARTGHHNDCFLASDSDSGTYSNITEDKAYLERETLHMPMGGESCNPNPPRSECAVALEELARFHWSYLNTDYRAEVLSSWQTGDCMDEIKRRLGYRLTLVNGLYSDQVKPGDEFTIKIDLRNDGFAAPFNPRSVELLLRHSTTGDLYQFTLPDDPRFWLAGNSTHSLDHTICTPADMQLGDYELLLNLPDPESSLRTDPSYAIRFANESVWEASTGYNKLLHTITVNTTATSSTCNSGKNRIFLPLLLSKYQIKGAAI